MKKLSDTTKFRIALADAGFGKYALTIFNDKGKTTRRLKLYQGAHVNSAPHKQKVKLVEKLRDQFGDRLLAVGPHEGLMWWGVTSSVVVKLKL